MRPTTDDASEQNEMRPAPGPEGVVDGDLAEAEAGGVRPAQQSVERVDPVVFGEAPHERARATRAILGDEKWIAERPMDTAMAVDVASTASGLAAMVAALQRRPMPAAVATALEMGLLLAADGSPLRAQRWWVVRADHDEDALIARSCPR